jgi:hypothetical protein
LKITVNKYLGFDISTISWNFPFLEDEYSAQIMTVNKNMGYQVKRISKTCRRSVD